MNSGFIANCSRLQYRTLTLNEIIHAGGRQQSLTASDDKADTKFSIPPSPLLWSSSPPPAAAVRCGRDVGRALNGFLCDLWHAVVNSVVYRLERRRCLDASISEQRPLQLALSKDLTDFNGYTSCISNNVVDACDSQSIGPQVSLRADETFTTLRCGAR